MLDGDHGSHLQYAPLFFDGCISYLPAGEWNVVAELGCFMYF